MKESNEYLVNLKVMSNMSYCRFENTYHDLQDCYENINRKASNERDERYRLRLKELVKEMSEIVDDEDFARSLTGSAEDFVGASCSTCFTG